MMPGRRVVGGRFFQFAASKTFKASVLAGLVASALTVTPVVAAASAPNRSSAIPHPAYDAQVVGPPIAVGKAVDNLISGWVSGAILFVRQGDRNYTVTAGYTSISRAVPMRPGDTYPIGSTTKTFTAVLVMRLVAQGKIKLDAPVSRYLPGLLPYGDRITVAELLEHRSGLYDWGTDPKVLAPILAGDLGHRWTPEQAVAIMAAHPLQFSPGTKFNYTDSDYIVLGLVVERVGGEPYAEQLNDYILRPLKLAQTSLPTTAVPLPDVHGYVAPSAYDPKASSVPIDTAGLSPTLGWAAGGIRSTVGDVANFFQGLFTGRLLPPAQLTEMEDTAPDNGQYGLGLMPTGGDAYVWGSYTQAINTTCGRAWGHGGHFAGYYELPISSPDGSRQAVLLVNADPSLMSQAQFENVYKVLDTAYCQGVAS